MEDQFAEPNNAPNWISFLNYGKSFSSWSNVSNNNSVHLPSGLSFYAVCLSSENNNITENPMIQLLTDKCVIN